MATEYRLAPEVAKIADNLIKDHHRHLVDNGYVRIEYVFRGECATSMGRDIWGKARKVTGLNAFIAREETGEMDLAEPEPFFVIEIAWDIWTTLTGRQKVALVDHELSHCQMAENKDGDMVPALTGHDLEEFTEIVRRHGLWNKGTEHFAKVAADQLSLLDAPGGHFDDETGIVAEAETHLGENEEDSE